MGEPRYTEKEMVMAQRAAWIACDMEFCLPHEPHYEMTLEVSARKAIRRYPLPKVERPRVVTDASGDTWRISDDWLQRRPADRDEWDIVMSLKDASRREGLQEILSHPSEFVDDEG